MSWEFRTIGNGQDAGVLSTNIAIGILIGADGVVPEPKRFKDRFPKRFGFGTTPLRQ